MYRLSRTPTIGTSPPRGGAFVYRSLPFVIDGVPYTGQSTTFGEFRHLQRVAVPWGNPRYVLRAPRFAGHPQSRLCCKRGLERHGRTPLCGPAIAALPAGGSARSVVRSARGRIRRYRASRQPPCLRVTRRIPACLGHAGIVAGRMRPAGVPRLLADQHADANAGSVAHLSAPPTLMPVASAGVLPFRPM